MNPKELRNKIAELLGIKLTAKDAEDLSVFTPEQLADAETKVKEAALAAVEAKNLSDAKAHQETLGLVKAEQAKRAEAEASTEAELAALKAEIEASDQPSGDDPEGDNEDPPAEDPPAEDPPAEDPPASDPSETTINVNATVDPAGLAEAVVAAFKAQETKVETPAVVLPDPSDVPDTSGAQVVLTAAADAKGHSAGTEMRFEDLTAVFQSKAEALSASAGSEGFSPKTPLATMKWEYEPDRTLDYKDHPDVTTQKIDAIRASAQERTKEILAEIRKAANANDMERLIALTAAGGLCAPVNVRYDIFTAGSTERPLRDSLVRFGANRGGIRFNAPPVLVDVDGAVATYEESDDRSGYGTDGKACLTVDCGDIVEVKTGIVTLCMKVGNFQRLTFAENFAAWWQLGRVAHARKAETRLWNRLVTEAMDLTATLDIGAARAVLAILTRACAQYRDRHRIGYDTAMRVHMPWWVVDIMMNDLTFNAPGDGNMDITRARIAAYFANRNIAVTFVMDGQASGAGNTYVQAASGALNQFPAHADFLVSVDGQLLFLDSGTLDFGTEIRDFSLIRSNDTGAFMETFENVANVGPDFERITISNLCADGTTAGPDASLTCAS